jgi:hypothetical protein
LSAASNSSDTDAAAPTGAWAMTSAVSVGSLAIRIDLPTVRVPSVCSPTMSVPSPSPTLVGSRLLSVNPWAFSASSVKPAAKLGYASGAISTAMIAAPVRGFWNPLMPRAGTMSAGGTRPMREPGGKTGSTEWAAVAATAANAAARRTERRWDMRLTWLLPFSRLQSWAEA